MLIRITDRKIPCAYIHVYWITKNLGPGPYNSLRQVDNRRYFLGLSLMRNQREAHILLGEIGKTWTGSCWEKSNFIMINEFKYGQTWKIWPSTLSLSLYSTFKIGNKSCNFIALYRSPSQSHGDFETFSGYFEMTLQTLTQKSYFQWQLLVTLMLNSVTGIVMIKQALTVVPLKV